MLLDLNDTLHHRDIRDLTKVVKTTPIKKKLLVCQLLFTCLLTQPKNLVNASINTKG